MTTPGADSAQEHAARVRAARGYAGLEREDLAKALNMSVRTYSRMEAGTRPPSYEERRTIAAACQVPHEFMENGWRSSAGDDAPLTPEEINRAAALLAQPLLEAARALRRAPGQGQRGGDGQDRPRPAAEDVAGCGRTPR